jgi:hypothetical protein
LFPRSFIPPLFADNFPLPAHNQSMLTALQLRPGLNRAPYESQPAQKLNKEIKTRPTHTPVGYRPILPQVTCFQHDKPQNHNEIRSTQETELHRSRCNPGVFRLKMPGISRSTVFQSLSPLVPSPWFQVPAGVAQRWASDLCSMGWLSPESNPLFLTTLPVNPFAINRLRDPHQSLTLIE